MNGWKWSALNTRQGDAMNIASASILIATRMALSVRAFARAGDQQARRSTAMMKMAGKLNTPPSPAPSASACGNADRAGTTK